MRVLLLAALLLAPLALADHVYSHRFVIEGRLVGSDGAPIPGREVTFFSEGEDFLEPCREGPHQSVTDEWGDFRFCYHQHELPAGARVGVTAGNASAMRPLDLAFRRTVVMLHEPNETGVAPEGWNETYRLSGRAWQVGPVELEGVRVFGVAVVGLPVNLTVRQPDGSETVFRTTTDAFGDYDLVLETEADPANVSLTLEAEGRAQPMQLDEVFHRTYAPIYVPAAQPADGEEPPRAPFGATGTSNAPGSTTPRVNPVLVVALGLALVGAILLSRRKNP